eukprot:CAMPEP_0174266936 /NCGR_PEP_ID=MMETSP0439-20130205/31920_1 /TAXON_ID=0 /ORGANISM="Stereomyxa ramosa, Strain Chinc5" /LENGTH=353 /DNA_ID=CAMNT_0015354193 /DNA_START=1713 /DNA_END=2771 /DNA_ORIENTATION=-
MAKSQTLIRDGDDEELEKMRRRFETYSSSQAAAELKGFVEGKNIWRPGGNKNDDDYSVEGLSCIVRPQAMNKKRSDLIRQSSKVVAGTHTALIDILVDDQESELDYVETFVLTYRSFLAPLKFMRELLKRFNEVLDNDLVISTKIKNPKLLRICTVLLQWVQLGFHDFIEEPLLTKKLITFIEECVEKRANCEHISKKLKYSIKKKLDKRDSGCTVASSLQVPEPILPSLFDKLEFDFIDLSPLEVARQLTLIECGYFTKITPFEFLNHGKSAQVKRKIVSPNITSAIAHFNEMNRLIVSLILSVETLRVRGSLIGRIIEIAEHCLNLNNFASLFQILSALESSPIDRLSDTW